MKKETLPPHDVDLEAKILGSAMSDSALSNELRPEWFFNTHNKTIAATMKHMAMLGRSTDVDSVRVELGNSGADVGGRVYLSQLADNVEPALFHHRNQTLKRLYQRRSVIRKSQEAIERAFLGEGELATDELVNLFERDALSIRDNDLEGDADIKLLLSQVTNDMEEAFYNKNVLRGIGTGYRDLDKLTQGLRGGQLMIIAARPSVGKTSLAMNIAEHVGVDMKKHVGVFSLEMTTKELMQRMVCSRALVDTASAYTGDMTEGDIEAMTNAMSRIKAGNLHLCDATGYTLGQIRAAARRWKSKTGIDLIIVDYLQLVQPSERNKSRYEQITATSNGMKVIAKEVGCPIICLCQLNRDSEKEDRTPRMSDLRDSGAIEQDADIICLLHPVKFDGDDINMSLIVAKNRSGRVGKVDLIFKTRHTRFRTPPLTP